MAKNATSFKPGVSGNPGGRPSYSAVADSMRKIFDGKTIPQSPGTVAERLAAAVIRRALAKGGARDTEIVLDRTHGKVPQAHELSGPGGAPLVGEELTARVAALWAKAKGK